MRITYLCADRDTPLLGSEGSSIHMRGVIDALRGLGHEVSVICANVGTENGDDWTSDVYDIPSRDLEALAWSRLLSEPSVVSNHLERDLGLLLANPTTHAVVMEFCRDQRPDVIYERYSMFGWAGSQAARDLGVPHILEVNAPLTEEQAGYRKFVLADTARAIEQRVIGDANAVTVVSAWLKDWVCSSGANTDVVHVIPNGCDPEIFGKGQRAAARQELGFTTEPVVGYVGSFQPWHDVTGLLAAVAELRGRHPELRVLLVGDGRRRRDAEHEAKRLGLSSSAIFTGSVEHREVPKLVAAMDVPALPLAEGRGSYFSPLKLFEYMAAGKATVAANVGQIAEVVDHERTGWLYEAGDHGSLVLGLGELIDSPELASKIGSTAREYVRQHHSWRSIGERIEEIAAHLTGLESSKTSGPGRT